MTENDHEHEYIDPACRKIKQKIISRCLDTVCESYDNTGDVDNTYAQIFTKIDTALKSQLKFLSDNTILIRTQWIDFVKKHFEHPMDNFHANELFFTYMMNQYESSYCDTATTIPPDVENIHQTEAMKEWIDNRIIDVCTAMGVRTHALQVRCISPGLVLYSHTRIICDITGGIVSWHQESRRSS